MKTIIMILCLLSLSGCAHQQRYDVNGNPIPSRGARFVQGFAQGYNASLATANSRPKVITCQKQWGANIINCQ